MILTRGGARGARRILSRLEPRADLADAFDLVINESNGCTWRHGKPMPDLPEIGGELGVLPVDHAILLARRRRMSAEAASRYLRALNL